MKIKLFTHTDLDGISCGILAKLAFKENVDIEYCNYDTIDKKVSDFFFSDEALNYICIFITDISIKEELANEIDNCIKGTTCLPKVILLDHHKTAEYLNKFKWAKVTENTTLINKFGSFGKPIEEKTCGTYEFFIYLIKNDFLDTNIPAMETTSREYFNKLVNFVDLVRQYDTWLWNTKYNNIIPKQLNDLSYIYGRDRFIEMMIKKLQPISEPLFSDMDMLMLELTQEKIDRYIESKQKQIIEKNILNFNVGVVFAEQYHSELGNALATNNPHLDFIVLINPSVSVSYRSISDKIDLGKDIASVYGGGGHIRAAGSPVSDEFKKTIIDTYFDKI
jgi:oligoribonuclease NrnB/cAMP/cGMP phosphodiesterase (DHH superfamily)